MSDEETETVYIFPTIFTDEKIKRLIQELIAYDDVMAHTTLDKEICYSCDEVDSSVPNFLKELIKIVKHKLGEINLDCKFENCILTNYIPGNNFGMYTKIDFGTVVACFNLDGTLPITILSHEFNPMKNCLYVLVKE